MKKIVVVKLIVRFIRREETHCNRIRYIIRVRVRGKKDRVAIALCDTVNCLPHIVTMYNFVISTSNLFIGNFFKC